MPEPQLPTPGPGEDIFEDLNSGHKVLEETERYDQETEELFTMWSGAPHWDNPSYFNPSGENQIKPGNTSLELLGVCWLVVHSNFHKTDIYIKYPDQHKYELYAWYSKGSQRQDLRGCRQKVLVNDKEVFNKVYPQRCKDELEEHGGNVVKQLMTTLDLSEFAEDGVKKIDIFFENTGGNWKRGIVFHGYSIARIKK